MAGARPVQVWTSPILVLPGGHVQVQPHVAAFIAASLEALSRAEKVPLSPFARHVVESCRHAAALAISGPADVRNLGDSTESEACHDTDRWMPASSAALLLELSREHVGRLAREGRLGPTRQVKGRRYVLRAEVLAMDEDRRRTA